MEELNEARKQAKRFGQLFQLIGAGFSEYIALIEQQYEHDQPQPQVEEAEDERPRNGNGEEAADEEGIDNKPSSSSTFPFPVQNDSHSHDQPFDDNQKQLTNMARWPTELEKGDRILMAENHRLYKLHAERLAKLQRDYAKWRMKLEKDSFRLFPSANPLLHSSSTNLSSSRSKFSRFAPPLLFCRCPSPQRRNRLYRPQSINSLSKSKGEGKFDRAKSQSDLDLTKSGVEKAEGGEGKESFRAIRAAMTAIEAEMCGMLGRLEFQVQGIVGFARLCTGDVFEVSIKHGHQKWRTRGKTQPDKSQRWDQQPASTSMNILWNVPVHIKACELGFLRSRCLNERQFDPAKFASAQPQLVTMNLNSVGSIKLRLIVSWLPLLSSKPPPIHHQIALPNGNNTAAIFHQPEQIGARIPVAKLKQHHSQLPLQFGANGLPPKVPPKRNQSLSAGISASSPPPENGIQMAENGTNGSPVKICLRDKKRQREQRIQMGISVAANIGREASRTDKDRWRNSSTTLLDELYKDLSKSIPTIDDLSALQPNKSVSSIGGGGGSLGPSAKGQQQQHRAFKSTDDGNGGLPGADLPPCSSSSVSEGRSKSAKRIFSFVKRGEKGINEGEERRKKEEWRKSISLGQIALNKEKRNEVGEELGQMEEPEEFREKIADLEAKRKMGQIEENGRNGSNGGSARRAKLSNLKKGRSMIEGNATTSIELNGGNSPSPPSSIADYAMNKSKELERALQTVDALLAKIDALRVLLAKLRPAEYTELVGFEAAMLNWEACLKLNRSGILCQLDGLFAANNLNSNGQIQNGGRNRGSAGQQMIRQRLANNRNSTIFLHQQQQQQHSPSTASDETDESNGHGHRIGGGHPHQNDQISENDSGIDSLRQYHSPYNSSKRQNSIGSNGIDSISKDRRKSIGTMLDVLQSQQGHHQPISATGTAQMDKCLEMHLARAQLALQAIFDVQESPFEYTLTKMLCRMEGVETIALESMLGLVQDLMAQCESNPQNVLLQLGLQFQLQQCWLSACQHLDAFLLTNLDQLRTKLRPICEPIVRTRYPKLVEKVLDSLCSLLCDGNICGDDQQEISLFQFVALFRGKQFPAFIENLSHEAWISANLLTGQPGPIREVMDRLRNVPVVPPMDSLRHIGLALVKPGATNATMAPIEKYLRKASPELAMDLSACFLCLLEHEEEMSRCGACRALANLGQHNSLQCLEFLSRSDSSAKVRTEAYNATVQIQRILRAIQQQEMTKI